MDISKKINTEVEFEELFEQLELSQSVKNSFCSLDFKNPTFCQEQVLQQICPTEELQKKLEKKQRKKLRKLEKERKKSGEGEEIEGEEQKKDKEQEIDEIEQEEQEKAKQFIIQSSYSSGKTVAMLAVQINDFYKKIANYDPKQVQKDQDEVTHGLFSVFLCQSREACQKTTTLAENLLNKFSKGQKKHLKNKEKLVELTQQEKNQNSNIIVYNLSTIAKSENPSVMPNKHYILVATPSQFLKFSKTMKIEQKFFVNYGIDDLDYMLSFGYGAELSDFSFFFQKELLSTQTVVSMSSEINPEISEIASKLVKYGKIIDVNLEEDQQQEDNEKELKKTVEAYEREYRQVAQFYNIGNEVQQHIVLYILYKLQFLAGKTVILCKDNDQVYKTQLFLTRIGIKGHSVLNEEDPKNLRYYVLSCFNTGLINTLITTSKILDDFKKKVFYQKKRKILQFKNLNNIIALDMGCIQKEFNELYTHFRGSEGTVISLIQDKEEEIEILTKLIDEQKKQHTTINIKEFPLKKHEIDAFKYRITDVVSGISRKQIKNQIMMDFKRKLLRSKELAQYFKENVSEKQMLIEDINSLNQQIIKYGIKCEEEIPDYLVPEMVKEQRKSFDEQKQEQRYTKIQVEKTNEDFQKSLKRRMEANNLTLNDVKKKRILDTTKTNDKFVYIDNEKEAVGGEEVDPSKLKVISSKKLWKLKHGFKLKKRNRRLERKGIYNA